MNKRFQNKLHINEYKIKNNIIIDSKNIKKTLKNFSVINNKFFFHKTIKKKDYILFNWNFLIKPNQKIISKIINNHKINSKNYTLLIKKHNKAEYNISKNFNLLTKILRANEINFQVIDKKISSLPLEFFIYRFNIKEIISLMSSTVFYACILFPKIKISLYFSLNKKLNKKYYNKEESLSALKLYNKNFKQINYY